MKTPYRHADKAMKSLSDKMGAEFQNLSSTLRFDELNVIAVRKQVTQMYERINAQVLREFREVASRVHDDTQTEIAVDNTEFLAAAFLIAIFGRYDKVTKYVYTNEWERKRDRLIESIMAGTGSRDVRQSLKRALDTMRRQVAQYGDNLTDEVRNAVFEEAGIEKVRWNTQRDHKVCEDCRDRDNVIYNLYDVPNKHYHCRCYLTAVR